MKYSNVINKKSRIVKKILRAGERVKMIEKIRLLEEKRHRTLQKYYKEKNSRGKKYCAGSEEYVEECYGNGLNKHFRW